MSAGGSSTGLVRPMWREYGAAWSISKTGSSLSWEALTLGAFPVITLPQKSGTDWPNSIKKDRWQVPASSEKVSTCLVGALQVSDITRSRNCKLAQSVAATGK